MVNNFIIVFLLTVTIFILIVEILNIFQVNRQSSSQKDFSQYDKYATKLKSNASKDFSERVIVDIGSHKSILNASDIAITDKLIMHIPTVGEVLQDEQSYYSLITSLTASPYQYMVQLDDVGIDYTKINDYELFLMLFPVFAKGNTSFIFGDLDISDASIFQENEISAPAIYCPKTGIKIDALAYVKLTDMLRKINLLEKDRSKPGNESAKKYLLEKERRKLKRRKNKPYEPYLEKLVIALVNTKEFPYDYDSCMNLSMYRFNQSFKQVQHKINFDNTMRGVYAGTIDTKKMSNKDGLSWIPLK